MSQTIKKIAALLLCCVMVFSLAACSQADVSWAMRVDDTEISAGLYLFYLQNAFSEAINETQIPGAEQVLEVDIDGIPASQWIEEHAQQSVKEHVAIEKWFDELGLEVTADGENRIDNLTRSYMTQYADQYEHNGIGEASVKAALTNVYKRQSIFNHYYGEEGVEEVSNDELQAWAEENYVKVRYILMPLVDADGELSEEEKADLLERANDYVERAQNGEEFNDLIAEYDAERYGTELTDEEKEDELRYDTYIPINSEEYPTEFIEAVQQMEVNDFQVIETELYIFVTQRLNLMEIYNWLIENQSALLSEMKTPEFEEMLTQRSDTLNVEFNQPAIDKYQPEDLRIDINLFG